MPLLIMAHIRYTKKEVYNFEKLKISFKNFCLHNVPSEGKVRGHLSMKKIGKECNFLFYCSTTIMNYEATERDRSFNAMHLAFALLYMIKSFLN